MNLFVTGASAVAAWAVGLIFFRMCRDSADPFYGVLGFAFWLLSLSWIVLGVFLSGEEQFAVSLIRIPAFVIVAIAVVDRGWGEREAAGRRGRASAPRRM